jgi:hypothetical protein
MTIGTLPAVVDTGKENALYSFSTYIKARFAEAVLAGLQKSAPVYDLGYEEAIGPTGISISDAGAPQLGDQAQGRELGGGKRGRTEQTQVEICVWDTNNDTTRDAERFARRLRDLVKFAVQMAGMDDGNGGQILPPIRLYKLVNGSPVDTGSLIQHPRDVASMWLETFIKDQPDKPNEKRYRILCRIKWEWYE